MAKTLSEWRHFTYISKAACFSLALLLTIQACFGIAPVVLAVAVESRNVQAILYAGAIFFGVHFLSYPLTYASWISRAAWKFDARRRITRELLAAYRGRVSLLGEKNVEQTYIATLSNSAQSIIVEWIEFISSAFYLLSGVFLV